jgi:ABC-type transport system involved in cytochrome c biogenesis permease subunit
MSTHITTPQSLGPVPAVVRPARPEPGALQRFKKWIAPVASLRLTVVLFALSMFLVFFGTIAQKDFGVWTVVHRYFRSLYVWVPLQIFFPTSFLQKHPLPGGFPFPGGWLIGGALLVNLLAAHLVRFRLTWKRSGILILHSGLILMMVGELITGLFAVEGNMSIFKDGSSSFLVHQTASELAVIDPSDPKTDDVVVVPERMLRRGGVIAHDDLPFDVEPVRYMTNSALALTAGPEGVNRATLAELLDAGALLRKAPDGTQNPASDGMGKSLVAVERPEGSGADPNQRVDLPAAYVRLREKNGGKEIGTYLTSVLLDSQPVTAGGKTYQVALRQKRTYKPYTVQLLEFRHDLYEGTEIPMNFSSRVHLVDPAAGEERLALIRMNEPLRYHGETFYQSSWLKGDSGTILQVVRNPGWLMPYLSCLLVSLGMLLHFEITLDGFLRKMSGVWLPLLMTPAVVTIGTPFLLHYLGYRLIWVLLGSGLLAVVVWGAVLAVSLRRWAQPTPAPGAGAEDPDAMPAPVAASNGNGIMTANGAGRGKPVAATKSRKAPEPLPEAVPETGFVRFVPWVVVGLGVLYLVAMMVPPADPPGKMRLEEFASLPVLQGGRVKPIDTVARTDLMAVSSRQDYFKDAKGNRGSQVQWLLDLMTAFYFENRAALDAPVIRIDSDQVLSFLGLEGREGLRYSLSELAGKAKEIEAADDQARQTDPAARDAFQVKIMELAGKLRVIRGLMEVADPKVIPPSAEGSSWQTYPEARAEAQESGTPDRATVLFHAMLSAYARNDADSFNKALGAYQAEVQERMSGAADKAGLELFFNHFEPFYQCSILYVFAFVLACLSWLVWTRPLGRAAWGLAAITLVVHTWALVTRMYIQGRPPVTNLYSSAIFIGWAAVLLCLGVELVFRNGIGTVVAAFAGAVSMLIAHLLNTGDTMEMLQAVLDTNFWLATHVVCVTLGYSTTYVAGLLGMISILCGVAAKRRPDMDRGIFKTLAQMTYGVVCFAMFFSFVGTVLGGIWADQSWGRFWGWDPKENGALLIVIWNALILHARWAGIVRERGLAVLAVTGNIITSWSWFGTNMLGIGLHSYGFTPGTLIGLFSAIGLFLGFIALGVSLPKRIWRAA